MRFKKPLRDVREFFWHHSGTANPDHDNIEWIKDLHVNQNGWQDIGYHFFINSKGELFYGRSLETTPAAQLGHNTRTIACCLSGVGNSFTNEQFRTMKELAKLVNKAYDGRIQFRGHKEINATECPHYDYKKILGLSKDGHILPWYKRWFSRLLR